MRNTRTGRTRAALAVAIAAALALPASAAATNLVADGGFESPPDGSGVTQYNAGTSMDAWAVGGIVGVDHVGTSLWTPSEGVLSVDLNASDIGSVSQTLTTQPGGYQVHYALAGNFFGPPAVKKMRVVWDGSTVATPKFDTTGKDANVMGWTCPTTAVSASSTSTGLGFVSTTTNPGGNNWYGPVIDDVRVLAGDAITVTGAQPSAIGRNAAGFTVKVSGTNFAPGATVSSSSPDLTVKSVVYVSSTLLKAKVATTSSAPLDQAFDLTVTNPDASTDTCGKSLSFAPAPTVSSVSPSSGPRGATGLAVVVSGSGILKGASVAFGPGVTVTSHSFDASTGSLDATLSIASGAAAGSRNVTVTNPNGGRGTCAGCFSVT